MRFLERISDLTKLILHRGLCESAVENSFSAFKSACISPYVWGVETDIQFTADGKCVCFHDKNGKRLLGLKTFIHDFKFEQLKHLKIVNSKQSISAPICPFKKYVKICKKYNKMCVIEFKYDFSDKQIDKVLKILKWHKYLKNCVLISFNQSILIRLRKMLPNQKLQLLVSNPMRRVLNFCIKYKVDVSMLWRLVRKDMVRKFNNFGIGVSVWGVKGYNTAIKMIGCGVESITADKIM